MRKTQPGAGWTKSPSPVLQGRSAESTTIQRAATYKFYSGKLNVLVVLTLAIVPINVGARGNKALEPLPIELAASLKSLGYSFDLSPDAKWLVYTTTQSDDELPPDPLAPPVALFTATGAPAGPSPKQSVFLKSTERSSTVVTLTKAGIWTSMPVWSPNSRYAAYLSDEGGETGLWIWDVTTGKATRFPDVLVRGDGNIRWSSNSEKLLCNILPADMTIAQANAASAPNNVPVSAATDVFQPLEAKEHALPIFVAYSQPKKPGLESEVASESTQQKSPQAITDLAVIDLRTRAVTRVGERVNAVQYEISPDNRYVVYLEAKQIQDPEKQDAFQQRELLILYDFHTNLKRVLSDKIQVPNSPYVENINALSWSPDSRLLAYYNVKQRQGINQTWTPPTVEIVTASIATGTLTNVGSAGLLSINYYANPPLWDQDGKAIFLIGADKPPAEAEDYQISDTLWRVSLASGKATVVSNIPNHFITAIAFQRETPRISPYARRNGLVVFVRPRDREHRRDTKLFQIDIISGKSRLIRQLNGGWNSIFDTDASGNTIVYNGMDVQHASDVWVLDISQKRVRQITNINPELDSYRLGNARMIDYYSEEFSEQLHAALLLPPDYRKGQRLPLIVFLYGFPNDSENISNFGFFGTMPAYNMHVLATRGYAVLFPDLRLRTGRQLKDVANSVLPGVRAAIEGGYADPERLGVMGYHAGTYAAMALISQAPRFKAAVVSGLAHPMDLLGAYIIPSVNPTPYMEGSGDQLGMGGTAWQYPERYAKNSPIFLFDQIETPVFIAYGKLENAGIHMAQLFGGLTRANKEAECRVYEDQHTIGRKTNVIDFWKKRIELYDEKLNILRDKKGRMVLEGNQVKTRN